ncbi:unnamed protein product [Diatraea saccharalis]|uniref:15-hydroxyprostaglandin dehydrogenase [NAD(+)]-like n=1 Tax=Diatraea saccharalis TaxID=40085 RepID=A0A9P0C7Q5_9NEOP|nr:unnamed protein product [Diatraea saccharalis]
MVYEVKDKVFLITGAANGIGAGTVRVLVAEDAKHVAILDVSVERGVNLQNELNSKFGTNKTKFYKCDVTNEEELFGVYKAVKEDQGVIDVVINNAGIMNDSLAAYKKAIDVNVTALISSTYKAMELMRKDDGGKGGTIINISSIAALHPSPFLPVYFSTKSAVLQFTRSLCALDIIKESTDIRFLTVCFGVTQTALYETMYSYDSRLEPKMDEYFKLYPTQTTEAAVKALVEAYKLGENGSIWLSTSEKPVKNITDPVNKAYGILTELCELNSTIK